MLWTVCRIESVGRSILIVLVVIRPSPEIGASYDDLLAAARRAEAVGFDGFFISDHYSPMGGVDSVLPGPTDAWTTIAGLARDTNRIRLGTLVSPVTFRWPGALAVQVAQIDQMSGGRVELGLGSGHYEGEHTRYGISFPPLGVRFEMLEEQLAIVRGMWRCPPGERFNFDGKHYTLADCPATPKPVQIPHPTIIIGGRGVKRTPRLAATYANEINVSAVPPAVAAEGYKRAHDACERLGRDPATLLVSSTVTLCCGADQKELDWRLGVLRRRQDARSNQNKSSQHTAPDDKSNLGEGNIAYWTTYPGLSDVASFAAIGTPDQVTERLLAFRDAGAQRMFLSFDDLTDLEQLSLVAETVLPHLHT